MATSVLLQIRMHVRHPPGLLLRGFGRFFEHELFELFIRFACLHAEIPGSGFDLFEQALFQVRYGEFERSDTAPYQRRISKSNTPSSETSKAKNSQYGSG